MCSEVRFSIPEGLFGAMSARRQFVAATAGGKNIQSEHIRAKVRLHITTCADKHALRRPSQYKPDSDTDQYCDLHVLHDVQKKQLPTRTRTLQQLGAPTKTIENRRAITETAKKHKPSETV